MEESIRDKGYTDMFRVDSTTSSQNRDDIHVVVDMPQVREEDTELLPARRSSPDSSGIESINRENIGVYVALLGLFAIGVFMVSQGAGVGATTYILHVIHEYGFTQAALHALSTNNAAGEFLGGIGLDVASIIGMKVTQVLNRN